MNTKILVLTSIMLLFAATAMAAQPEIVEVTDSFGHTYNVNDENPSYGSVTSREGFARAYVDEAEIPVDDNMEFTICVTEVQADDEDDLDFLFTTRDGSDTWSDETCHTYQRDRSDYKNIWHFGVRVRNQDDIEVANTGDFEFQVDYYNLKLVGSDDSNVKTYNYDTVTLSQTEYESLKEQKPEPSQITVEESKWNDTQDTIEQQKQELQEKENRISQLQQRIDELEQTVEDLRNQLTQSENDDSGGTSASSETDATDRSTSSPDDQQSQEQGGFLGNLFGGLFG